MNGPLTTQPRRFRTPTGVLVAAVLVVAGTVALALALRGSGSGRHAPRWAQLPDPGAGAAAGATLGFAGGRGNGRIRLDAFPASGIALHVVCRGRGSVTVRAAGIALGSATCPDGQAVSYVITDPDVPVTRDYDVQAAPGTIWRIAVTTG